MTMDLPSALSKLANYRTHHLRRSQETFDAGVLVLDKNGLGKLDDDSWAFLEQLFLAAIDVGRVDVADRCLKLLSDKFPGSPRVDVLSGIRIEATESLDAALNYYRQFLEIDPTNVAAWKRLITVLRRQGDIEGAVKELQLFLETFYSDVEGWLELADIYAACNQHTHALQTLTHVMLLVPQNPFYIAQAAETAYTAGDLPLSARLFLQTVDLIDEDDARNGTITAAPAGVAIRAWYGLRLCLSRLAKDTKAASASPSKTAAPAQIKLLSTLANERLAAADPEAYQAMLDELPTAWAQEAKPWQ